MGKPRGREEKSRRRPRRVETFPCPHCGADVPVRAAACKSCGSDASTGWAEDAAIKGVDLPGGYGGEDEFDYDAFVAEELGTGMRHPRFWRKAGVTALVLLLVVLIAVYLS